MGSTLTAVKPSELSGAELDKVLLDILKQLAPEDRQLFLDYGDALHNGDEAKASQLKKAVRSRVKTAQAA